MAGSVQLPLLFLDVDGPLIPFGAGPEMYPDGYPTYSVDSGSVRGDSNPLLGRIDPALGPRLKALPCQLVWATTWMGEANESVGPRLGLGELAVVAWAEGCDVEDEGEDERRGLHWKTRALVEWAAGRSFVWVDDEITDVDRAWVSAHHDGRALLHRVDARRGLSEVDFVVLDAWLRGVAGQAGFGSRSSASG